MDALETFSLAERLKITEAFRLSKRLKATEDLKLSRDSTLAKMDILQEYYLLHGGVDDEQYSI